MDFRSTLSLWDQPEWHTEHQHSDSISGVFADAYSALAKHSQNRAVYLRIYNALSRLLGMSMSVRQHEHLFFLLGMCAAADSRYNHARALLDEALELARMLNEQGDIWVIRMLRASVHRALNNVGQAAIDLRDNVLDWSVYAERSGKSVRDFVEPGVRVDVYSNLSGYAFFQADYAGAQEALEQGRALLPLLPKHTIQEATLHWTQALLYRLQRKAYVALEYALKANAIYTRHPSPLSQIRLQYVVAETALDCAETVPSGTTRQRLVETHVLPALESTMHLARQIGDDSGTGLLLLTHARTSRVLGRDEIRDMRIESVIHLARRIDDDALLGLAHTALGDEYISQGKVSRALNAYRDTLGALDGSEAVAMKLPARMMIERIETNGGRIV